MSNTIPKSNTAKIKICKMVLNTEREITWDDFHNVSKMFQTLIDDGTSPADIAKKLNIESTDFGMTLKKCFNVKLLSLKESVNNYMQKIGRSHTDEKKKYFAQCSFKFDPFEFTNIPGYELLTEFGIYHPVDNTSGVCRDHMISKEYGFRHNIDSSIISHPANCQFLTNRDNLSKGTGCCITLEQLTERLKNWHLQPSNVVRCHSRQLPKRAEHKLKISDANKLKRNYNNGSINIRLNVGEPIPEGFVPGMLKSKW